MASSVSSALSHGALTRMSASIPRPFFNGGFSDRRRHTRHFQCQLNNEVSHIARKRRLGLLMRSMMALSSCSCSLPVSPALSNLPSQLIFFLRTPLTSSAVLSHNAPPGRSSSSICLQHKDTFKLKAACLRLKSNASLAVPLLANLLLPSFAMAIDTDGSLSSHQLIQFIFLADLDPAVAGLLLRILGPVFASLNFLFIIRIVMSWYPQLPVDKLPYVIAFAPTEPVLEPTRKLIPPVGGVDVSPVIWVALISFLNEILLGQQGLLVLLSQQQG